MSEQPCELHNPPEDCHVRSGLCSGATEELLRDQENCVHPIWRQKSNIYSTVSYLVRSLCRQETFNNFVDSVETNSENDTGEEMLDGDNRLIPIESVLESNGVTIARVPPLENTKHRYPWICSLRSVVGGGGEGEDGGGGGGGGGDGGGIRCPPGYTDLGRVCVEVVTGPANYLSALTDCERRGASLATVRSQQEQEALSALTGSAGAWIGLTDLMVEGDFAWVDSSPLTFTAWREGQPGQPNNNNNNQHCTWIRGSIYRYQRIKT